MRRVRDRYGGHINYQTFLKVVVRHPLPPLHPLLTLTLPPSPLTLTPTIILDADLHTHSPSTLTATLTLTLTPTSPSSSPLHSALDADLNRP